jgi:hypothetical protein
MQVTVQPRYMLQDYECPICRTGITTKVKKDGKIIRVAPANCKCCLVKFDWKDVWWAKNLSEKRMKSE